MYNVQIDEAILKKHKINSEEFAKIQNLMQRVPNLVELGVFSAMWSEHCSYKTTRIHLKNMHTTGSQVICGPGENAGIIDGGDDDAIVFKMESHNHPSYIEPFNGAATGVGGILRDVFTMGARPIATLNSLRFGDITIKKTKDLLDGVVSGISFYGNCVGVPTIGGECTFDESYNANNLTNAMAIGVVKKDKIFYSAANKVGGKVLYFGSKTGKDGIHGASMSSDSFDSNAKANKPTVQIGDPFVEKLLIEACLELMSSGSVLSIQDMGAAGLTCSCAEMAGKGNNGIEIDVAKVPLREEGMNAYEIMLSESQERMLMILNDGMEEVAINILKKWNLSYAVIGEITDTKRFVIKENGQTVADIPIHALSEEAPIYERKYEVINQNPVQVEVKSQSLLTALKKVLKHPDMLNKEFIWQRYDTGVRNETVVYPGEAGAGVVCYGEPYKVTIPAKEKNPNFIKSQLLLNRLAGKVDFITEDGKEKGNSYMTKKGIAASSKCNSRFVLANPELGAMHAVCATYRSIVATGARPLAITNCLNFANPEVPHIMGQIVASIGGISKAAKALNYPVVSGNVSLYNQTNEKPINPTPTIGGVGIIQDAMRAVTGELKNEDEVIFVIGDTNGHLQNSIYAASTQGIKGGEAPSVNLEEELLNSNFVAKQIEFGLVSACSAVIDGGILGTLTESALSSKNNIGFIVNYKASCNIKYFFGEDGARFICVVSKEHASRFIENAVEAGVIYNQIGFTALNAVSINGEGIMLDDLRSINKYEG